ncbi:JmjC domain-containing histone demethylation protein 1 [Marasmius tenuissimus]|uniref:JmjC domain-containing histone demethylation protein 1 n=1 Tax=Marasmius tenuissimus TaxID=585030 RepID=A0ABR2ZRY5_9AGAR
MDLRILDTSIGGQSRKIQDLRNRRSNCIAKRRAPESKRPYKRVRQVASAPGAPENGSDIRCMEYNMTSSPNSNQAHVWVGNAGSILRTPIPHQLDTDGRDVFGKAAHVLYHLSAKGFIETSTSSLVVTEKFHHESEDSKRIMKLARDCMAHNVPVLAKGPRLEGSWLNGLDADRLNKYGIELQREVQSLDFYDQERRNLESGESPPHKQDQIYEHPETIYHRICERTNDSPEQSTPDPSDSDQEIVVYTNMLVLELMASVNEGASKYVLDLPTSKGSGIPYGRVHYHMLLGAYLTPVGCRALNDFEQSMNNTSSMYPDEIAYPDLIWALAHGSQVITWWHHDCDGKMTVVNAESGAKIWTIFRPKPNMSAADFVSLQLWLCERKDKLPKPEYGDIINILLLPGDTLFMPPGTIHMVYTPVPSIFRGSSFWLVGSLHLTRWSRRSDSDHAVTLTNVDHKQHFVFSSLVRIALGIPVMAHTRKGLSQSSLLSLYDMLINGQAYIPTKSGSRNRKQTANKLAKQLTEETSFYEVAIRVLERLLLEAGFQVPSSLEQKKRTSAQWVRKSADELWWKSVGEFSLEGIHREDF